MSLHYLDPNDEPRECPRCEPCDECGGFRWPYEQHDAECSLAAFSPQGFAHVCHVCNGIGQLGNPEARPEIEVKDNGYGVWRWREHRDGGPARNWSVCAPGTFPTESAAVEAARKALGGGR